MNAGAEMNASLTIALDEWLKKADQLGKTMVSKQGHELHFDELEEKIRRQGGADDPAAVAAKIYRRAGGVPSKTSQSSKKLKRQKKERAEKSMRGGGPFIGPRGGKWADAAHTAPWKDRDNPVIVRKKKSDHDGEQMVDFHQGKAVSSRIGMSAEAHGRVADHFMQRRSKDFNENMAYAYAAEAHNAASNAATHNHPSDHDEAAKKFHNAARYFRNAKRPDVAKHYYAMAEHHEKKTTVKKSAQTVRIGNLNYAIGTSDALAERLEKGDFQVGGMAAFTLAGPAMKRGELPCLAPEDEARHQQEILDQTVTLDPAGWGGAGGLDEWWRNSLQAADQYSLNVPHEASNVLRHYVQHPVVIVADDPQYQSIGKAASRQG